MANEPERQTALSDAAARQLANATKTTPQMKRITPRWLTHLLQWVPVEAGIYRLNRVKDESKVVVECSDRDERELPQTFVDYEEKPREYMLSAVNTVVDVHTRVSDLYSAPYSQIGEQLRLTIEIVKERQESELVNNSEYGMLHSVAPEQRIKTRAGAPTPDDLDDLLSKVWKEPGFFLAHPAAIAAFGRECTFRGVPPPTVSLFGSQFVTWRGIPLIPSDKLAVKSGKLPGLKGTDEFKRLSQNIPDQGNEFTYMSERFGRTLFQVHQLRWAFVGRIAEQDFQRPEVQAACLESSFRTFHLQVLAFFHLFLNFLEIC